MSPPGWQLEEKIFFMLICLINQKWTNPSWTIKSSEYFGGFQEIKTDESGNEITLTYWTIVEAENVHFELNSSKWKTNHYLSFYSQNDVPGSKNISWISESVL